MKFKIRRMIRESEAIQRALRASRRAFAAVFRPFTSMYAISRTLRAYAHIQRTRNYVKETQDIMLGLAKEVTDLRGRVSFLEHCRQNEREQGK